eukprot:GFUD01036124.1.p1 GENE.GFUD01036124.1~~GFUD01036124.1.p1  ORF type:complete len:349 (-),score=62.90 GFUD01036124.1:121-1167(-)
MMEDSDILTLGWGSEPSSNFWPSSEEFVTLDVEGSTKESQEYATLEVAKERDRQYFNSCVETEKLQEWDIMRLDDPRTLPAPTPTHVLPTPIPTQAMPPVTVAEFYVESFHPQQYPTYTQHPPVHYGVVPQESYHHTYQQQLNHPSFAYSPFNPNDKRHTVRSPVSGKFVRGGHLIQKRQDIIPKERKRPGPKAKIKTEEEPKPPEEPEYDPEVIANAHLTMEDDFYKCSVCKMKFKQPGNARRHIITVHRNEKPHNCVKCGAKFGRKDKLKTHMMRNHGFSNDDIKATFKHSGQGRQRSSILVNRDNRKSTESTNSSDTDDSNPLNLKTSAKKGAHKHLNTQRKRKQ